MFKLALASLWNRKASAILTVLAIAISVMLLLGVERIRVQAQENFANTISGTDIIVGGRTGSTQLLLASVFHIGSLNQTLSWQSYEYLQTLPRVSWTIPMAMGDSVRGLPVVATTADLFSHFKYGNRQPLRFAEGQAFAQLDHAVMGAEAATKLGLQVGDELTVSHGAGGVSFSDHDDHPFRVQGILQATGTPVDQAIYIPLEGLGLVHGEYVHEEEHGEEHDHGDDHEHGHDHAVHHDHAKQAPPVYTLSAVLIGLEIKPLALRLQRQINTYTGEPLTAILPGFALQEFWRSLQLFDRALLAISSLVVATGLLVMLTTLLASLRERRREIAVLRSIGAGPVTIFTLLVSEALLLTIMGIAVGVGMLYGLLFGFAEPIQMSIGFQLRASLLSPTEWTIMGSVLIAAISLSLIPAWRAYRNALADGLTVKL
ncbi:ABC transporter permease [Pseudidiomarina taiwanensis]|uniref:ABC transporter permease n=1 Tax=Pseudidiomarina taiwanensis TaxID=337250 RepID=A0A432ZC68_9GAMM|nr:ABC transporter permease [Pseudidiomarina taiwanensis]RUO75563.1 ABC transporter permease [Pseudidiomarina taiwanensis]